MASELVIRTVNGKQTASKEPAGWKTMERGLHDKRGDVRVVLTDEQAAMKIDDLLWMLQFGQLG